MNISVPWSEEVHEFWTLLAKPAAGRKPGAVQFPGDSRRWIPARVAKRIDRDGEFVDVRLIEFVPPRPARPPVDLAPTNPLRG
jgi:hypothetical protein